MENLFGVVVDNNMLEKMPNYVGIPITQEDRAREASDHINAGDKNINANSYVQALQRAHDDGLSTLCLVYNSTGDHLSLVTDHNWNGCIGRVFYPPIIGNGQWAAFLHVPNKALLGSEASVVYRGKNRDGQEKDYLVAWSTPYGPYYNKAYCEIGTIAYFNNIWDITYEKLQASGYASNATADGCQIHAQTESGRNPKFIAKITTL